MEQLTKREGVNKFAGFNLAILILSPTDVDLGYWGWCVMWVTVTHCLASLPTIVMNGILLHVFSITQ
jgi:hypothetical protein